MSCLGDMETEKILHDNDIREPLFDFLEQYYGKTRIIEEKRIGRSRADIVMVRPMALAGIEIKSDADTYARLKRQVKDYNQYFDQNYVVVGSSHAMHVGEYIPDFWGIISAEWMDENIDFYVVREAKENPKVNRKKKLGLLWRPELAHIQELNQMPKYRQKSKEFVIDKILQKVPGDVLQRQISEELFERDYNEIEDIILSYKRAGK